MRSSCVGTPKLSSGLSEGAGGESGVRNRRGFRRLPSARVTMIESGTAQGGTVGLRCLVLRVESRPNMRDTHSRAGEEWAGVSVE